jgi:sulfate permease, SulP family
VVGLSAAATILILGVVFSNIVAELPKGVVSGVLIALGVMMFDGWSLRSVRELFAKDPAVSVRRGSIDLAVVGAVMLATVFGSVMGGGIGCVLSMLIFVVDMSRPIVRRQVRGDEIFSKRIRSQRELAFLQKSGAWRVVLQLEGVLFFVNAEDLSLRVKELLKSTQIVVLDFRKVTDIDVSGAKILASLVAKAKQQARIVVFCSVPPSVNSAASRAFGTDAQRIEFIRPDLDSALEYIEELGPVQSEIQLGEVDLIAGLPKNDVETLRGFLVYRRFDPGEHLCEQGDAGDRMWLLVLGSVSVRIRSESDQLYRRIISLGPGTMVGEMALVESAPRSTTIVADSDVAAFEEVDLKWLVGEARSGLTLLNVFAQSLRDALNERAVVA